jgi:hypothetical protein
MVKKKLRKAIFYCKVLLDDYGKYFTSKDNIELKVLLGMMEGAYFMEKKQFKNAKEKLVQIIHTVTKLQEGVSLIERAHLQEIIDNSRQSLRFCKFQLKEFDEGEEEVLVGMEDKQQIEDILRLRAKRTESKILNVFGQKIDIEDKDLKKMLDKIELLRKSYESSLGLQGEEELLWELMSAFDEGIKKAKRNKAEAGTNVALSTIWERVESYLQMTKHQYLLRRNLVILDTYQEKNDNVGEVFSEKEVKMDRRPQERARLIDNILESLRTVKDLHGKLATAPSLYTLLENYLRGVKCLNITRLFYRNKMYKEALSLHHQVKLLISSSCENARLWENLESDLDSFDTFFSEFASASQIKTPFLMKTFFDNPKDKFESLGNENNIRSNMAKVALVNQQQLQMEALNLDFMQNIELKQIYTKSVEINSLFDLVSQNRPREDEEVTSQTIDKQYHLDFVRVPPLNKLVAPKPIMLDMAYDFVDFPKKPVQKIREESPEKPKSRIGGLFSGFWGKK